MPETATKSEPRSLPRANVRAPGAFGADKYVRIPDIPVFRAHRTKDNDGNPLTFGPNELNQLAQQCNRRIQESGDYAGIIVGHTSDKDDVIQRHPEVIGYAGLFRLGTMGLPGGRQVYVILADFWIRKDKLDVYHAHPRRSAELWVQGDHSFLDPIALLGGDPPRLDLGLAPEARGGDGASVTDGANYGSPRFFYAMRGNARVLKYSMAAAAFPCEGNVSPRSADVIASKRQGGGKRTIGAEAHVVKNAAKPQPNRGKAMPAAVREETAVTEKPHFMKEFPRKESTNPQDVRRGREDNAPKKYAGGEGDFEGQGTGSGLSDEDLRRIVEAIMQTAPMQWAQKQMEGEQGEEGLGGEMGAGAGEGEGENFGEDQFGGEEPGGMGEEMPAGEGEELPPGDEAGGMPPPPPGQGGEMPPAAGPEAGGMGEEPAATVPPPGQDSELEGLQKKYGALPSMDEEDAKKYAACCSRKKKYEAAAAAQGSAEKAGKAPHVAAGDVEQGGKNPAIKGEGSAAGNSQHGVDELSSKTIRYSMLESRIRELDAERSKRIDQERWLKLQQLANYRIFDVRKEFERVKYSKKNGMSDDQFAQHCEVIADNYQPTGVGTMPFPIDMVTKAPLPESPREASKPLQYSQKTVEKAVKYVCDKREAGKDVDYASVLEKIEPGRRNPLLSPSRSRTGTPSPRKPMLSASPLTFGTPWETPARYRYWSVADIMSWPGWLRKVATPLVSCGLKR